MKSGFGSTLSNLHERSLFSLGDSSVGSASKKSAAQQIAKADVSRRCADITDNLIFNELRGITPTMVLKQHKKVEEQEATIRQLSSILAEQQRVFTAHLKERDSKIQAVNERLQRVAPLEVVDRK